MLAHLKKTLKANFLHELHIVEVLGFKGNEGSCNGRKTDAVNYRIEVGIQALLKTHHRKIQQKSCFILASNQWEELLLSLEKMFDYYTHAEIKIS